jgi:hypothetical protein
MKPTIIIFSSKRSLPVAEGIRDNLQDTFDSELWTEGFFDEHNTIPLWIFLKKLMCYDCAAVVLGDDDVRLKEGKGDNESVPRDNVIFELGAAMARMGPQKTFIFTPQDKNVVLPSYFRGVIIKGYRHASGARGDYKASTGSACGDIKRHLRTLKEDAFHSDLPAQGLAVGYFNNFIERLYRGLREDQVLHLPSAMSWKPSCGFTITSLVPDDITTRESADRKLKELGAANVMVRLFRDRDMSVYALPRASEDAPLHILDIPTTLLTSSKVIEKIDAYWGNFGDILFQQQLQRRELVSFARKLRSMRQEMDYDDRIVFVDSLRNWHIQSQIIQNQRPPIL